MGFWIPMIIMIAAVIFGLVIGEDKVNKWFKCKHSWQCLDKQGEIDNKNPVRIVCSRCGRDSKIENK